MLLSADGYQPSVYAMLQLAGSDGKFWAITVALAHVLENGQPHCVPGLHPAFATQQTWHSSSPNTMHMRISVPAGRHTVSGRLDGIQGAQVSCARATASVAKRRPTFTVALLCAIPLTKRLTAFADRQVLIVDADATAAARLAAVLGPRGVIARKVTAAHLLAELAAAALSSCESKDKDEISFVPRV